MSVEYLPVANLPLAENPSGGLQPLLVDSTGKLYVNTPEASGGTSSNFGSAIPPAGTAAGFEGSTGLMEPANLDPSGNLLVNIAAGSISVTVAPVTSNTISNNAPSAISTSSLQAIAANISRKKLIIQNIGTTALYILLGTGSASASNLTFILPAGGSTRDGSSIPYIDIMWQGAVQWISSSTGGLGICNECT